MKPEPGKSKLQTEFEAAYTAALQDAQGNKNAPTPDNVKQLANELVADIDALPM